MPNPAPISGRATVTMLPSRPSMKVAKNTTESIMAVCLLSSILLMIPPI